MTIDYAVQEVRGMQAGYIPLAFRTKAVFGLAPAARGEPIPPSERAILTDISKWQGNVNFDVMKLAGAQGVVAKCTQGTTIFDSKYSPFVAGCKQMPFGAYHFLVNSNGTAQADWYTSHLQQHTIPMMHWVDVEVDGTLSSSIYQWAVRTRTNLGLTDYAKMGLYTSAYKWSMVVDDGYKAWCSQKLALWVAHYGTDNPLLPSGWSNYVLHQYTANGDGHFYGCDSLSVDLDRCRIAWLSQFLPPAPANDCLHSLVAWARRQADPYTGPEPED